MTESRTDPARTVLELLDPDGDFPLPALSREQLLALGDEPVLPHGADALWWEQRTESERELVLETAQRGLVARGLLRAGEDDEHGQVDEQVQVILTARSEPSWVAVLGEPEREVQLAAYGIDVDEHRTAAVMLCTRLAGVYLHRLVTPELATALLAEWLLHVPEQAESSGSEQAGAGALEQPVGRTVELLLPREPGVRDDVGVDKAIVMGNGVEWVLSVVGADDQPGEPIPADHQVVQRWLIDSIGSLSGA